MHTAFGKHRLPRDARKQPPARAPDNLPMSKVAFSASLPPPQLLGKTAGATATAEPVEIDFQFKVKVPAQLVKDLATVSPDLLQRSADPMSRITGAIIKSTIHAMGDKAQEAFANALAAQLSATAARIGLATDVVEGIASKVPGGKLAVGLARFSADCLRGRRE